MKYYELETIESEVIVLQSHPTELKKGTVVVVGLDCEVVTAKVINEIDDYTALVTGNEIQEIIQVIDLENFHKKLKGKSQKAQIARIMKNKIEEIKMIETLEKYAGKDSEFSVLLETYKILAK